MNYNAPIFSREVKNNFPIPEDLGDSSEIISSIHDRDVAPMNHQQYNCLPKSKLVPVNMSTWMEEESEVFATS